MEGISDIKIEGIDEKRPPNAEHKLYIDLFFRLNHQAPNSWCEDFNSLMSSHPSKPKIKPNEGFYIQTYVRSAEEIAGHLEQLKKTVVTCTSQYIEKIERGKHQSNTGADKQVDENSPQGRLNKIIAELNFD